MYIFVSWLGGGMVNNDTQCVFASRGVCYISKTYGFESRPDRKGHTLIRTVSL